MGSTSSGIAKIHDTKPEVDISKPREFGFKWVDASEIENEHSAKSELSLALARADHAEQQRDVLGRKLDNLSKFVTDLLNQLALHPDKEYMYFPDKVAMVKKLKADVVTIQLDGEQ